MSAGYEFLKVNADIAVLHRRSAAALAKAYAKADRVVTTMHAAKAEHANLAAAGVRVVAKADVEIKVDAMAARAVIIATG